MSILSWPLRSMLFIGSVAVFTIISLCIRKRRIQLKDGIFWLVFGFLLILISVFPVLAVWASRILGIQSPSNCVFLILIFLLGCHQLSLTIRISQLEMKNNRLVQSIAIYRAMEDEEKNREKENMLLFR